NRSIARISLNKPLVVMATGAIVFAVNLGISESDRRQLLKRTFDRNYIVKYLGAYNIAIYDAIQNLQSTSQRGLADSNDITAVENYTKNKLTEPDPEMFRAAEEKNIIKIHLDQCQ